MTDIAISLNVYISFCFIYITNILNHRNTFTKKKEDCIQKQGICKVLYRTKHKNSPKTHTTKTSSRALVLPVADGTECNTIDLGSRLFRAWTCKSCRSLFAPVQEPFFSLLFPRIYLRVCCPSEFILHDVVASSCERTFVCHLQYRPLSQSAVFFNLYSGARGLSQEPVRAAALT